MTIEEAKIIRHLRVEDGYSWRRIAEEADFIWPEKNLCRGNQLEGVELCHEAAKLLGENAMEQPWN